MTREVQQIEAVKYALRQSRDGMVVSFVIHPEDVDTALQCLPIGARIMFGWYAIGDDEKPVAREVAPNTLGDAPAPELPQVPKEKDRRRFGDLAFPEQAGIRRSETAFHRFLEERHHCDTGGSIENAAIFTRKYCGVASCAELSRNHNAANKWRELDAEYNRWLTDQKYADIRR